MNLDRSSREWMQALARVRTRAARLRGAARADAADVLEALDEALELADAMRVECAVLQQRNAELELSAIRAERETDALLDSLPSAVVLTDCAGHVIGANRAASALLGVSQAKLRNELLLHFAEDRGGFTSIVRGLPRDGRPLHAAARLRPRDRAPFEAAITVVGDPRSSDQRWMWVLERTSAERMKEGTLRRARAAPAPSDPCAT